MAHFDHAHLMRRTKAQILDEVEGHVTNLVRDHNDSLREQSRSLFRSMGVDPDSAPVREVEILQFENLELKRELEAARAELRTLKGEQDSSAWIAS
jgi:hypothetical protein